MKTPERKCTVCGRIIKTVCHGYNHRIELIDLRENNKNLPALYGIFWTVDTKNHGSRERSRWTYYKGAVQFAKKHGVLMPGEVKLRKNLNIRIDNPLLDLIQKAAALDKRPVSQWVRVVLEKAAKKDSQVGSFQ